MGGKNNVSRKLGLSSTNMKGVFSYNFSIDDAQHSLSMSKEWTDIRGTILLTELGHM